mmetsp:Transcript_95477/g.174806  ORF Transcript_95477/g.174806 Transcript_95477/m.174806 type:complete len:85 (+) Transcript_95477:889-1143(+)
MATKRSGNPPVCFSHDRRYTCSMCTFTIHQPTETAPEQIDVSTRGTVFKLTRGKCQRLLWVAWALKMFDDEALPTGGIPAEADD